MLLPCRYEEKQGGASGDLGGKKKTWKISYGVPASHCYLLMLCVWPSALSSSGMSLKATICWSICLPLAPCTTSSLLPMMRPGLSPAHPLCCYPNALWESRRSVCGGVGGSAPSSLRFPPKRGNRNWQSWNHLVHAHMKTANEPGAAAF